MVMISLPSELQVNFRTRIRLQNNQESILHLFDFKKRTLFMIFDEANQKMKNKVKKYLWSYDL